MTPTEFLTTLWGNPPQGQVLTWMLQSKRSVWWLNFDNIDRYVANMGKYSDLYFGVSLGHPDARLTDRERVTNSTSYGLAGLWADVDIADAVHKKENLPPDADSALEAVRESGYEPSIVVHSGHGLQCWWLFKEPWLFETEHERRVAQQLCWGWHDLLAKTFANRGWTLDATHDLARVMRLPGSTNWKSDPKPVEVIHQSDFRWRDFPKVPENRPESLQNQRTAVSEVKVDSLTLNPDASPSEAKLNALLTNLPEFGVTWRGQRTDFKDQTPSVYDLSIARVAVLAGWTDQEICDLLILHRRESGQDLKLREDYYRRTIAKARS